MAAGELRIAKGVKGVKEVRNDLTINYLSKRTDPEIAAEIKTRLQWDIWMNGDLIHLVVENGNVTLTGTLGSAIGKSRAFDDAWVNGVTSVNDSGLKIMPFGYSRQYGDVDRPGEVCGVDHPGPLGDRLS